MSDSKHPPKVLEQAVRQLQDQRLLARSILTTAGSLRGDALIQTIATAIDIETKYSELVDMIKFVAETNFDISDTLKSHWQKHARAILAKVKDAEE